MVNKMTRATMRVFQEKIATASYNAYNLNGRVLHEPTFVVDCDTNNVDINWTIEPSQIFVGPAQIPVNFTMIYCLLHGIVRALEYVLDILQPQNRVWFNIGVVPQILDVAVVKLI